MTTSAIAIARQQPTVGIAVLAVIALIMAGAALMLSPIAQPQAYHNFAEQRTILGIPRFGDVISNIGYLAVALLGFVFVFSRDGRARLATFEQRLPWLVFFGAVGAIGIGSTYYHANPTNQTLLWDRLPMVVAFTAILAAFVADRIHSSVGTLVVLPFAVTLGVVSLIYWHMSEAAGRGDLRFYFLVQALVIVLVPLICVLFRGRHTSGKFVVYILVLYGLAIACEQFDVRIFEILGGTVSGHTIKHVLAALAIYMVIPMARHTNGRQCTAPPAFAK